MKPRISSTKIHQIPDVALFRDTLYLLLRAPELFRLMGVYIAFLYVKLYTLA